jgi:hypothetical protein
VARRSYFGMRLMPGLEEGLARFLAPFPPRAGIAA